ncbi:MAG TPA: hypothetical protein VHV78_01865 [Gemmatimonadaceae bacterium]|jgi:hypothetical protein|nr:hypothetical protein [Gemmatimonadaceae bacterium]
MSLTPTREWTPSEVLAASNREIPQSIKTASLAAFVIGAVLFIVSIFLDADRAWSAFHANWLFFAAMSQAGIVFVAAQRITTARWSRGVIRLMEGYVAFLPVAFVFLLLTLSAGRNHVFPWTREAYPTAQKATYYNPVFLTTRDIVIFGAMTVLGVWYVYTSLRLDVGRIPEWGAKWAENIRARMRNGFGDERREIHSTHSLQGKLAAWTILLFGLGWSVLAWDLSMGLTLHFQSTLYSWWFFMGGWLCALMLFSVLVRAWNAHLGGAAGIIDEVHYHDIGKLCFAFTAFWGYLTFGQYLVIWYGNMGEETFFMRLRLISPWKWLTVASVILVFFAPFFGLLGRSAKVNRSAMTLFAVCSLVGMWIMRYIEVYPSRFGTTLPTAPFGIAEVGCLLLYVGAWAWCYTQFMDAFPRIRVTLLTSPYRDEVQVPVNPETMEPLPAHE